MRRRPRPSRDARDLLVTDLKHPVFGNFWRPGHIIGYEHTFIASLAEFLDCLSRRRGLSSELRRRSRRAGGARGAATVGEDKTMDRRLNTPADGAAAAARPKGRRAKRVSARGWGPTRTNEESDDNDSDHDDVPVARRVWPFFTHPLDHRRAAVRVDHDQPDRSADTLAARYDPARAVAAGATRSTATSPRSSISG